MTETQSPPGAESAAGRARRPWFKHPVVLVAVVVVLAAAVYGTAAWVAAKKPTAPADVEDIQVDAPDRITVEEDFQVTTTALDDGGNPQPGARLSLASDPALTNQRELTLRTGDDGTATFSGLEVDEEGIYRLTVSAGGTSETVRVEATNSGEIGISAPSGVAANEPFTVAVSFSRGEPVEGQELTVYVEPDGPWKNVKTGADGTAEAVFTDGVAEAGKYTLLVKNPQGPTEAKQSLTVTPEGRD